MLCPPGALPQVSAVFSPDVLPVVYDCPVCDTLNTTLLECPRRFGIANGQLGELTIQLGSLDLLNVLSGIVGVLCEGTVLKFLRMYTNHFPFSLSFIFPCQTM